MPVVDVIIAFAGYHHRIEGKVRLTRIPHPFPRLAPVACSLFRSHTPHLARIPPALVLLLLTLGMLGYHSIDVYIIPLNPRAGQKKKSGPEGTRHVRTTQPKPNWHEHQRGPNSLGSRPTSSHPSKIRSDDRSGSRPRRPLGLIEPSEWPSVRPGIFLSVIQGCR